MTRENIENRSTNAIKDHGLGTATLSNCSLNDLRSCKTSEMSKGIPKEFPTVALFSEATTQSATLEAPTGTDVSIGGENCHMNIRFQNGQMIITPSPNSVCDVRVTPPQSPGLGKADY